MNRWRDVTILIFIAGIVPTILCAAAAGAEPTTADLLQYVAQEATRQDLVDARLNDLIPRFRYLARDLGSNGPAYDEMKNRATALSDQLQGARDQHLVKARMLLRQALEHPAAAGPAIAQARREVQEVRRQLASLLLQAGMSQAAEVFGGELRDVIDRQDDLTQNVLDREEAQATAVAPSWLAEDQKDLADHLGKLLGQLGSLSDVAGDPVAYVRMSRARKMIDQGRCVPIMGEAADDISKNTPTPAIAKQVQVMQLLSEAELKLRPGAELQSLSRAKNVLRDALAKQQALHRRVEGLTDATLPAAAADVATQQDLVRRPLRTLRAPVDMDGPVGEARTAMIDARKAALRGSRADTTAAQGRAEDAIVQALALVEGRLAELQELDKIARALQAAMNRLKNLQAMTDRQTKINDDTESMAADKKSVDLLTNPQERLGIEADQFLRTLPTEGSKWTPLLRMPVERARGGMTEAAAALKLNQPAKATPPEAVALASLQEAVDIAAKEVRYLEQLWRVKLLFLDMKNLARHLKDLEDEQRDIRIIAEAAGAAGKTVLDQKVPQETLAAAVDVAKDAAIAFNAGTLEAPLTTASEAMTAAAAQLTQDHANEAVPPQKQAEAALRDAQKAALDLALKEAALADLLALLEKMHADTLTLLQRQVVLRMQTQKADEKELPGLADEQEILQAETTVYAEEFPVGQQQFKTAANEMGEAVKFLKASNRNDALIHQVLAEEALKGAIAEFVKLLANVEQLDLLVAMPDIPTELSLIMRAVLLASDQEQLRAKTRAATPTEFPAMVPKETAFQQEAVSIGSEATLNKELLDDAAKEMGLATGSLKTVDRTQSVTHQKLAETALRRWIAKALIAAFAMPENMAKGLSVVMPSPDMIGVPIEAEHIFTKLTVEGEGPERAKSDWEWLSPRDRAALNENFARELPLEFRQILKAYYETLSKPQRPSLIPTSPVGGGKP